MPRSETLIINSIAFVELHGDGVSQPTQSLAPQLTRQFIYPIQAHVPAKQSKLLHRFILGVIGEIGVLGEESLNGCDIFLLELASFTFEGRGYGIGEVRDDSLGGQRRI
jgi:hypothetical protein